MRLNVLQGKSFRNHCSSFNSTVRSHKRGFHCFSGAMGTFRNRERVARMYTLVISREPEQQESRTRGFHQYLHSISTKRPRRLPLATRRASHDSTLLYPVYRLRVRVTVPYCWNHLALSRPAQHYRFTKRSGIDWRQGLRALPRGLCTTHRQPIATPEKVGPSTTEAAARAPDARGKPMQGRCLERRASMMSRCETVSSNLCRGQGIHFIINLGGRGEGGTKGGEVWSKTHPWNRL